jgi:hypothetical protein
MTVDPDATPQEWVDSLTPRELAQQLRVLLTEPHKLNHDERTVVLTAAAEELEDLIP